MAHDVFVSYPTEDKTGDLGADGLTDLLSASPGPPPRWCRDVGDRSFACEDIGPTDSLNHAVLIFDLDGDGSQDVVFGYSGGFSGHMGVCHGPLEPSAGWRPGTRGRNLRAGCLGRTDRRRLYGSGVLDLRWQDPTASRGYAMNRGFECERLEYTSGDNFAWAPTG